MNPIRLASIQAFAFRVPVMTPIKVAFGTFRDRPFVLVRVVDEDGAVSWGEAWANWPAVGAEHRARLVVDIGERLVGKSFDSPQRLFQDLSKSLEVLVIQTGEVGPIAQAVAANRSFCRPGARRCRRPGVRDARHRPPASWPRPRPSQRRRPRPPRVPVRRDGRGRYRKPP